MHDDAHMITIAELEDAKARIEELEAENVRLRKAWHRFDKAMAFYPNNSAITLIASKAWKAAYDDE
jgi:hypothetical protein